MVGPVAVTLFCVTVFAIEEKFDCVETSTLSVTDVLPAPRSERFTVTGAAVLDAVPGVTEAMVGALFTMVVNVTSSVFFMPLLDVVTKRTV